MSEKTKKLIPLIAAAAVLILAAVIIAVRIGKGKAGDSTSGAPEAEWAVYWYLCGSDLESDAQSATRDISEMLSFPVPEGVKVVIEAGGTPKWHTKGIDPDKITRLLYDGNGLKTLETLPGADMGEASTLSDFLSFCRSRYPAKHTMLILWDHGGGSLYGVCYDQNYSMDCLSYTELKDALSSAGDPKFDIIGFDACLMSSIDTIASCKEAAQYMIASQQLEPACGWDYAALTEMLGKTGDLTAEELGTAICDSYYAGCEKEGLAESATLALIDLSRADALLEAYDEKLLNSFDRVLLSDEAAASLRRNAAEAENYGANGRNVGYTDMIDLLGYMGTDGSSADYAFTELIEDTVLYQVRGEAFNRGCGISCYYPLDASLRSVLQYAGAAAPGTDVSLFYRYMISPDISDPVSDYAERRSISEHDILKNHFRASTLSLAGSPLEASGSGDLKLKLPADVASDLSDVRLKITGVFEVENTLFNEGDTMYFRLEQGEYPAKKADYGSGEFVFDGKGKQITADGVQFATYVVSDTDESTVVYTPAVIGDRDGVLFFSVGRASGKVSFLGAYTGKVHTTGQYTMAGILGNEGQSGMSETGLNGIGLNGIGIEEYDEETASEKEVFDYTFTFDELYEYHERFGYIGEPYEIEEYYHGSGADGRDSSGGDAAGLDAAGRDAAGRDTADRGEAGRDTAGQDIGTDGADTGVRVFERLSPLAPGQIITPIFSCSYSKTPQNPAGETAYFANWETTESVTCGPDIKFTYEAGQYSTEYRRMQFCSYILSDAWGNTAESDPVLTGGTGSR